SAPFSFTVGATSGSADLSVTNNGPATDVEGSTTGDTYTIKVTNSGPDSAQSVVLTDTLAAGLQFTSATPTQGTFSQSNAVVTFSIGSVANGQTVTMTVTPRAIEDGTVTNSASASSSTGDPNSNNNSVRASTAVSEPVITVSGPITVSGKRINQTV